jgi:hypothetical protein
MTLEFIHQMQTIETDTKTAFIYRNPEIFEGMGKFPQQYRIMLKKNNTNYKTTTQGTIITERHCRIWRLITKCDQPSDWVHNMVIVEKAYKSLQICLDKKHKHKNIIRKCSDKYEVMSALTAYRISNSSGLDRPPAQMNLYRAILMMFLL